MVVTGTGAPAKRKALGQTINSISSEDLNSGSVQTVTDALQGRIPGLVGANMGGQGGASRIRLRGTVSLTQRNQPLIYIDGVRIDNSMTDNASISTSRLNDIDPNNEYSNIYYGKVYNGFIHTKYNTIYLSYGGLLLKLTDIKENTSNIKNNMNLFIFIKNL